MIVVAKAEQEDFNEINKLIEDEFSYAKKSMKNIPERVAEGSFIFVAKEKKELLGFIEFKLIGVNAKLFGLAVKEEFREKGIGGKLFDFFLSFCKRNKIEKVSLIVKENNFQAKELYKSRGFVKTKLLDKKIESNLIESMELNLAHLIGVN